MVVDQIYTLIWSIWCRRNAWVFNSRLWTFEQTLKYAVSLRVAPVASPIAHAAAGPSRPRWLVPPPGVVKINTDASFKPGSLVGFGMVARDEDGHILAAASLLHGSLLCASVAEAMALRWSIQMARDLGFMRIQVETDSLVVFNAWKRRSLQLSYVAYIVRDCLSLSSHFVSFALLHSPRPGNLVADFLAKLAPSVLDVVWIEEVPPGLLPILADDVALNVHE
ncbi:hypothetical protein OROGR_004697 [Orobanche gracilis]